MSCGAHIQYQPRLQYMHSSHGTICSTTILSPSFDAMQRERLVGAR